jgi:hypothetical protein
MMPLAFGLMMLEMARLLYRDARRVLGLPAGDDETPHPGTPVI